LEIALKFHHLKAALAAVLLMPVVMTATAQTCPCGTGTRATGNTLVKLLAGQTVCGRSKANTWQEFHSGATEAGGPLIDWKLGPGHPMDPSKQVGTWSVQNVATADSFVVYNYGSGGSYSYAVCQAGNNVNFCGVAPPAAATNNARSSRGAVGVAAVPGTNVLGASLIRGQMACSAARTVAR